MDVGQLTEPHKFGVLVFLSLLLFVFRFIVLLGCQITFLGKYSRASSNNKFLNSLILKEVIVRIKSTKRGG